MSKELPRFQEALEYHLNMKLQAFVHSKIDSDVLNKIYITIFDTINVIFSKSSNNITDNSKRWLAQKYYESINVGDSPILSEDNMNIKLEKIYDKVNLKNLPIGDLHRLEKFFNESSFHNELIEEIRSR